MLAGLLLGSFIAAAFTLYGLVLPVFGLALVVWLAQDRGTGAATVGVLLAGAAIAVLTAVSGIDKPIPWFVAAGLLIAAAVARVWWRRR
ncbi:MAG: hypothetical protein J2O48_02765 [Solirubrobacterales bacterium]|nr:hypothetical protein [Solirubrobacterales bacterium]